MDKEDEVLPVEKEWGRLLQNHPYGVCPELSVLQEIAEKGPQAAQYEARKPHLDSCENCRDIVDQIRLLDTQWQQTENPTGKVRAGFTLRDIFGWFRSPGFALGTGLSTAVLLVFFCFDLSHREAERRYGMQLEQQFTEQKAQFNRMQQALMQGARQSRAETAQMEKKLRAAEKRPPLVIPDDKKLIALASRSLYVRYPPGFGVTRGEENPLPLLPEYPSDVILRSMRPIFRWKKMPGADDYQMTLTPSSGSGTNSRPDEAGLLRSPWQSAITWEPADAQGKKRALRPGQKYSWRVAWRKEGKRLGVSAIAEFETIDAQAENRLEDALLVSGIQQAQAGQVDEAEKAFQSVLAINPQNGAAQRLREALRAKRPKSVPVESGRKTNIFR